MSRIELGSSVLTETKEISEALAVHKGFEKALALFLVGGVSPAVEESPLLSRVVDLRDYLEVPDLSG